MAPRHRDSKALAHDLTQVETEILDTIKAMAENVYDEWQNPIVMWGSACGNPGKYGGSKYRAAVVGRAKTDLYRQFQEHEATKSDSIGGSAESQPAEATGKAATEDVPITDGITGGEATGVAKKATDEATTDAKIEEAKPDEGHALRADVANEKAPDSRFVPLGSIAQESWLLTDVWEGPSRQHVLRSIMTAIEEHAMDVLVALDEKAAKEKGEFPETAKEYKPPPGSKLPKYIREGEVGIEADDEGDVDGHVGDESKGKRKREDKDATATAPKRNGSKGGKRMASEVEKTKEIATGGRTTRGSSRTDGAAPPAEPPKTDKKRKSDAMDDDEGEDDGETAADTKRMKSTKGKAKSGGPLSRSELKRQQAS